MTDELADTPENYDIGHADGYEKALTDLIERLEESVDELAESDGYAAQGMVESIDIAREMLNERT